MPPWDDQADTSLDLIIRIPEAAASYEQALSIYQTEDAVGEPSTPALQSFAEQLSARFRRLAVHR